MACVLVKTISDALNDLNDFKDFLFVKKSHVFAHFNIMRCNWMYFYALLGKGKRGVNTFFGKTALVLPRVLHHQLDVHYGIRIIA